MKKFTIFFLFSACGLWFSPLARGEWQQITTGNAPSASVEVSEAGIWKFHANVPADQISQPGLELASVSSLKDLSEFTISGLGGSGGGLVMTEKGWNDQFLAVYNDGGKLSVRYRRHALEPLSCLELASEKARQLTFLRRGRIVYAHSVVSGKAIPLVAIDFGDASEVLAGPIGSDGFQCQEPAFTQVKQTRSVTVDGQKDVHALRTSGVWKRPAGSKSSGVGNLENAGVDGSDFLSISLKGLLPGKHEIWVRYTGGASHSSDANLKVSGFGVLEDVSLNQQVGRGLWIGIGAYDVSESQTTLECRLSASVPGSGKISFDGMHEIWSEWNDADEDGLPDVWEVKYGLDSNVRNSGADKDGDGSTELSEFLNGSDPNSSVIGGFFSNGQEAVIFVDGISGSDAYDGFSENPQWEITTGARKGPKKTVGGALKLVKRAVDLKRLELRVNGQVDVPAGGLQNLPLQLTLTPGPQGMVLNSLEPKPAKPFPYLPSRPKR